MAEQCCTCNATLQRAKAAVLPCLHPCCLRHFLPNVPPASAASAPNSSPDPRELRLLPAKGGHSRVFCRRCHCDVTLTPSSEAAAATWRRLAKAAATEGGHGQLEGVGGTPLCPLDGRPAVVWCRTCRVAACRSCARLQHELHELDDGGEGGGVLGGGQQGRSDLEDLDNVEELRLLAGRWMKRQPALMEELHALQDFSSDQSPIPPDPQVSDALMEKSIVRLLQSLKERSEVQEALQGRQVALQTFQEEARATVGACREAKRPLVAALSALPLRALLARGCQAEVRVGAPGSLPSLGVSLHVTWALGVSVDQQPHIRALGVHQDSGDVILGDTRNEELLRLSAAGKLVSRHPIGRSPSALAVGQKAVAVVAEGRLVLYDVHDLGKLLADVGIPGGTVGNDKPAPSTVAALRGEEFLVGNLPTGALARFDSSGKLLDTPRCPLRNPVISLHEDSDGHWLVSSWGSSKVTLMTSDGRELGSFRRAVRGQHFHWHPNCAVALESGHVVVADYYFHEVLVFDSEGNIVFKDSVPGVGRPRCLAYCPALRRLLVASLQGEVVAFTLTL